VNPTPSTANVTAAATPSPANPTNNLPTGQQNPFQMFGMPPMMNAAGNPFGADPLAMMNNPMFAQMMSQMMSNPQMLDQVIGTNPQLASMITPDIRQQMQSPEFLQLMSNPQMIQQMLQMTGGMGGMGAGMNPLANIYGQMPPVNSNSMPFNPAAIAGMFGGQPAAAPTTPAVPPEQLYQTQLAQLQDMGFYSPQENIRALQMTGGNVEAAVEWLFSRPPGQM
jgi:ubiquilin